MEGKIGMPTKVKKSGLGKGLDSLIPEVVASPKTKPEPKVVEKVVEVEKLVEVEKVVEKVVEKKVETLIKITEIEPNRKQPRKEFNEDALLELAESIKQHGVLQPLLVQKREGYYEIIAGERRWRASKLAGIKEVPVIIKDYTEQQIVEVALIENIQREDLNPIEEALAYKRLLNEFKLKQDEVAEKVSKSRVAITNSMRLLKLTDEVQQMVIDGMITSGHARALIAIEDKDKQIELANEIFEKRLSVREVERLVKNILEPKPVKVKEVYNDQFIYKALENKIKDKIGSNVAINRKNKNKGKIEIEYYSTDDLERIVALISKIK